MKLWQITFFLLPIIGIVYAGWRIWHLLPLSAACRWAAVTVLVVLFAGLFFYISHGLDSFPRKVAVWLYEIITSFPMVLLYLVMVFLILDVGRLLRIVPSGFVISSLPGTVTVTVVMLTVFIYGYLNYVHKVRQPLSVETEKPLEKPLKVVMMSDLHLGYHNRLSELKKWVRKINSEHADMIIIAGDVIDISVKPLIEQNMAAELRNLNAPVYACLGNHEYYAGEPRAQQFYKDAGINLLIDSVAESKGICIIGRDDRTNRHRQALTNLIAKVPEDRFTILIDHQPHHLEEAQHNGVDFQLSGHTHYGQVWPISWIEDMIYEKAFGSHQRGDTHYYVTSGIGIWGGKFRIGTRSEYVVLTIKPKQ